MKALITSLYLEKHPDRRAELLECLRRNIQSNYLDEIHLFLEDQIDPSELPSQLITSSKLRLISWNGRTKYCDFFTYANHHLSDAIVIIANADIYFDETLIYLDDYDLSGRLLCLSRWNVNADGSSTLFEHAGSQDAWIFRTPLQHFFCEFFLGIPGCDNRLAGEAEKAGLRISNPSRSIRAHHLHLSQIRNYTEMQRLHGLTETVPPIFLETSYPSREAQERDKTLAEIALSETMGYTIARLEVGVSSHINEIRPFTFIPKQLVNLPFTQVVAYAVSPIELVFLSSGKIFLLVANDWDGYLVATAWLSQNASKEKLPMLETKHGVGFEVWSLGGDAGQRLVIPTQVMLIASQLVRSHDVLASLG